MYMWIHFNVYNSISLRTTGTNRLRAPVVLIPTESVLATPTIKQQQAQQQEQPQQQQQEQQNGKQQQQPLVSQTWSPSLPEANALDASTSPNESTLDYVIHSDGKCTCKLCGEVVPSRTHWYRYVWMTFNDKTSSSFKITLTDII